MDDFGLFGQADSFGNFLSLLGTDVKTLVWACDGGIVIDHRIIGIDDFRVDTTLFIGADGTVIHLDISKYKN